MNSWDVLNLGFNTLDKWSDRVEEIFRLFGKKYNGFRFDPFLYSNSNTCWTCGPLRNLRSHQGSIFHLKLFNHCPRKTKIFVPRHRSVWRDPKLKPIPGRIETICLLNWHLLEFFHTRKNSALYGYYTMDLLMRIFGIRYNKWYADSHKYRRIRLSQLLHFRDTNLLSWWKLSNINL